MPVYTLEDLKRTFSISYYERHIMDILFNRFYGWLKKGNEPLITDVTDINKECSYYQAVIEGKLIRIRGLIKDISTESDVHFPTVEEVSFEGEENRSIELEKRFKEFVKNQDLKELMGKAKKRSNDLIMLQD